MPSLKEFLIGESFPKNFSEEPFQKLSTSPSSLSLSTPTCGPSYIIELRNSSVFSIKLPQFKTEPEDSVWTKRWTESSS